MKLSFGILIGFLLLSSCSKKNEVADYPIDFDKVISLDCEVFAEVGIKEAYNDLIPELKKYLKTFEPVTEEVDSEGRYKVYSAGNTYEIFGPGIKRLDSYANGTFYFFEIINRQLKDTKYRFYALYGWNDLQGIFLSDKEYEQITKAITNRKEWPYIPTLDEPYYGMAH